MKFDEVLKILGGFGRYQWYAFFFLNAVNYLGAFSTLQHVFYAGESDHWCKTFSRENCSAYGLNDSEQCTAAIKAVSIPPAENYPDEDPYYYDNCRQWDLPDGLQFSPYINHTDYNASKVPCKDGWEFNTSQYKTTIRKDWNLVCDDRGVPNTMTSVFFCGFMAGSFIFGVISDWFGRKKALMLSMVIWFLGMLVTPFTASPWQYYVVRFVTATGQLGRWLPAYVLVNEFVAAKWRIVAGVLIGVSYSLGYMTVAVVAMGIREWRVLAFVPIIPVFLCLILMLFLSESVRWLLNKGRVDEAEDVIRKVGRWNNKEVPDVIFDEKEVEEFKEASKGHTPSFIDLYRMPNMCFRTLNLQYNWMTNSMVYYGLSFSTRDLGSDEYWTFFISGAVEIPALIYATVGVRWFGRKINMVGLELIGGAACLSTIFIEDTTAKTVVAMLGKFCITATFNIVYLWTSEMYPTPVRTVTIGLCSVTARVGSIVAPFIFNLALDLNIPNLHLIVFGAATLLAGLLLIPLPETKGKKLPETIREGENFGKCACMKNWSWGRDDDDESVDVDMYMHRTDVYNPAFVPDEEGYPYAARPPPPPYEECNEKGCQFPEKPREKKKRKRKADPGSQDVSDRVVVESSSEKTGHTNDSFVNEKGEDEGGLSRPGEVSEGESTPQSGKGDDSGRGDSGGDDNGGDRASGSGSDVADGEKGEDKYSHADKASESGGMAGSSGDRASESNGDRDGETGGGDDKRSDSGSEKSSDSDSSASSDGDGGQSHQNGDHDDSGSEQIDL